MQTRIDAALLATTRGRRADEILRSCVHCGFCNATCPTYQVRGDELDGPRGRIYLIKGLLESAPDGSVAVARTHLDRCLTCRACETTCPSGVRYGELAEIGREMLEERAPNRGLLLRLVLWIVPRPRLLRPLVALGRFVRWLLPRRYRRLLEPPPRRRETRGVGDTRGNRDTRDVRDTRGDGDTRRRALLRRVGDTRGNRDTRDVRDTRGDGDTRRRALLWQGCVQRVVTPEVNAHLGYLLRERGFEPVLAAAEECCGGLALHVGRTEEARAVMARNVRRLSTLNVDIIVSSASGCGVTLKDYGRLVDSAEANSFAERVHDVAEVLADFRFHKRLHGGHEIQTVAWHPPCTLQHGQGVTGLAEGVLRETGYRLVPVPDAHLCCGSAGSYSLLQPELAGELKVRKAAALSRHRPDVVATANIGCQTHLADALDVPVVHWLELLR